LRDEEWSRDFKIWAILLIPTKKWCVLRCNNQPTGWCSWVHIWWKGRKLNVRSLHCSSLLGDWEVGDPIQVSSLSSCVLSTTCLTYALCLQWLPPVLVNAQTGHFYPEPLMSLIVCNHGKATTVPVQRGSCSCTLNSKQLLFCADLPM